MDCFYGLNLNGNGALRPAVRHIQLQIVGDSWSFLIAAHQNQLYHLFYLFSGSEFEIYCNFLLLRIVVSPSIVHFKL